MELIRDGACADWLRARGNVGYQVGSAAGTGFPAYARILHPVSAALEDRTTTDGHGDHPVVREERWGWADVADRTGSVVHPHVTWATVSGRDDESDLTFPDGWRVSPPEEGWFDPVELTDHLAAATTTPEDLVAGFWDGWSELSGGSTLGVGWQGGTPSAAERAGLRELAAELTSAHRREQDAVVASLSAARFAWRGDDVVLAATDLRTLANPAWLDDARLGPVTPLRHTPQILWPRDHSWVMASEIDRDSTILAGSRTLIDAVLADGRLEAFEVAEDDAQD